MKEPSSGAHAESLLAAMRDTFMEAAKAEKRISEISERFGEPDQALDIIDDEIPGMKLRLFEELLQIDVGDDSSDVQVALMQDLNKLRRLCLRLPLFALLELAYDHLFNLHKSTANPYRQREEILDEIESVRKELELLTRSSMSGGNPEIHETASINLLSRIEDLQAKVTRSRRLHGVRGVVWLVVAVSGYIFAIVTTPLLPVSVNDLVAVLALVIGLCLLLWYISDRIVLAYRKNKLKTVASIIVWTVVFPLAFQLVPDSGIRSGKWPNIGTTALLWAMAVAISWIFFMSYLSGARESVKTSEVTEPTERIKRALFA